MLPTAILWEDVGRRETTPDFWRKTTPVIQSFLPVHFLTPQGRSIHDPEVSRAPYPVREPTLTARVRARRHEEMKDIALLSAYADKTLDRTLCTFVI